MHPVTRMAWNYQRRNKLAATMVATVLYGFLLSALALAATTFERDSWENRELEDMRAVNPHATEQFERAENLAADGKLEDALALFEQTKKILPVHGLPRLRRCEVLTALDRGAEGLTDCYGALQSLRTPRTFRAIVRALVGGPGTPTPQRIGEALSLLATERKTGSTSFELPAAMCDVAERIGNGLMLQSCAEELLRIDPNAADTHRAMTMLDSRCPPARFWVGWGAIAALLLGTGLHALRRASRRLERKGARAALVAAVVLASVLGPHRLALAESATQIPRPDKTLGKWAVSDDDPESSIPPEADRNKDPLDFGYWLQDLILKAEQATKRQDNSAAVKFYRAMVKAVPDRAIGYIKLCAAYEATGEIEKAAATCGGGLLQEGVTVGDYAHYVRLVLRKPGDLSAKEQETLRSVIDHLKADPSAHPLVDHLECEIGTRNSDLSELRECVPVLVERAPKDLGTIRFQWALALREGHMAEAEQLIERAKASGLNEVGVQSMTRATSEASHVGKWRAVLKCLAIGLLGAAVGIAFAVWRRRASPPPRPAVIKEPPPQVT
jgi:hypothetical protein